MSELRPSRDISSDKIGPLLSESRVCSLSLVVECWLAAAFSIRCNQADVHLALVRLAPPVESCW